MIDRATADRLGRAGQAVTIEADPADTAVIVRVGGDLPGDNGFSVLVERPNGDRSWQPSTLLSA